MTGVSRLDRVRNEVVGARTGVRILGHSIEGSEVCISGDRSSLSTWFGSQVMLLVLLLNNHWFHATQKHHTNKQV